MIAPLVSDMGVDGHDGEYYVVLEVTQLEEGGAGGPQVVHIAQAGSQQISLDTLVRQTQPMGWIFQ